MQAHTLRTDAHGDPQGLRCLAQIPVDGLGPWHAAGHRADQQRRAHSLAQQRGAQVDLRQVQLGQCAVFETDVLPASGHRGRRRSPIQHDVQMFVLSPAQGGVAHARSIRSSGRRRCVGSNRRQGAQAAASGAFRPTHAGLPLQRRCGSGWSKSGSTARGSPPSPRSTVPTARESILPPSPGAACAYGRPTRR